MGHLILSLFVLLATSFLDMAKLSESCLARSVDLSSDRFGPQRGVELTHPTTGTIVSINITGANIMKWMGRDKIPRYFTSDYGRGGNPICEFFAGLHCIIIVNVFGYSGWPQFSTYGSYSKHGFVRNTVWALVEKTEQLKEDGTVSASFSLKDLGRFHADFKRITLRYQVTLDKEDGIRTELFVVNSGDEPVVHSMAFHNYFYIRDLDEAYVLGMHGATYYDQVDNTTKNVTSEAVTIKSEFDGIFNDLKGVVTLVDKKNSRRFIIERSNSFSNVVVWNPWVKKAKGMADLKQGEVLHFVRTMVILLYEILLPLLQLCVEPMVMNTVVAAGTTWSGYQYITVVAES